MKNTIIWCFSMLFACLLQGEDYTIEFKNDSISVALKKFNDLRLERNPEAGLIFMTPAVAAVDVEINLKLKDIPEWQIIAYLCKYSNSSYKTDTQGNYYIFRAPSERLRLPEPEKKSEELRGGQT